MKNIVALLGASAFLIFGIFCLFWTEKVRNYYLRNYTRGLRPVNQQVASYLM